MKYVQKLRTLREGLEKLRLQHYECEDSWYSCALSAERGGSCLQHDSDTPCSCGCTCWAEVNNNRIDALLRETS